MGNRNFMNYSIYVDTELVGSGLSPGELNQWLLDLNQELNSIESLQFKGDLGFSQGGFEDFLYENELIPPISARFGKSLVFIVEDEF